jgi:hypothetical protein
MKQLILAALLAAAASATAANAGPYADRSGAGHYGIVESVREVPLGKYPPGLAEVFEHAINPETAQEVVVRLGDERAVVVVQDGPRRFPPGQRVLVVQDADGAYVEKA